MAESSQLSPESFLAAAPFLTIPLIMMGRRTTYLLGPQPSWAEEAMLPLILGSALGLCLCGWRSGRRHSLASLAGTLGAVAIWSATAALYGALGPLVRAILVAVPSDDLDKLAFFGLWAIPLTLSLPLAVALARCGRLQANLAVLSGLGVVVPLMWDKGFLVWIEMLGFLAPYLALVALAALPRRWQTVAPWLVLLADWALCVLSIWYYRAFVLPETMRPANPIAVEALWDLVPIIVLLFGSVLLVATQGVAAVRARRAPAV